MARLTSKSRKALKPASFVFPESREYPINDIEHGRKALQLGAAHAGGAKLAKIRAAVHRKFPSIGSDRKPQRQFGAMAPRRDDEDDWPPA